MATVAHIIRSDHDPVDREKLGHETGQQHNNHSDPWQTEPSFSAQRRIHAAPSFVPATISYDEWGVPSHVTPPTPALEKPDFPSSSLSTAEWYRSLTAASVPRESPPPPRPSSPPSPRRRDARSLQQRTTKNDWFISKVLRSEPSAQSGPPALSLSDLLARDPPPLPSEGRFEPPVWLHIGPSNRGFGMLQRSGWSEGEGLGAHIVRSATLARDVDEFVSPSVELGKVLSSIQTTREVIDLTLADSEVSEDVPEEFGVGPQSGQAWAAGSASHTPRPLLTPLPTILKADRLGIGLKARTEGPYKKSKKRVTHSAAALAAHIRSAEEMRRKKGKVGKGRQGFAKVHKKEEGWRKSMLAYLND